MLAAVVALPLLAGCAALTGKRAPEGGETGGAAGSSGPETAADTTARPDTLAAGADTVGTGGDTLAAGTDSVPKPSGPVTVTDVERLAAMGPVYTPYDVPPLLQSGSYLEELLRVTLLPVVEKHDLPPDEWARFWLLVDGKGRVRAAVLQLTSGHAAFDDAARAAALQLRYRPARRGGEIVPVWVLKRISLLMG